MCKTALTAPPVPRPPDAGAKGLVPCLASVNCYFYFHLSVEVVRVKKNRKGGFNAEERRVGTRGAGSRPFRDSGFGQFPWASLEALVDTKCPSCLIWLDIATSARNEG